MAESDNVKQPPRVRQLSRELSFYVDEEVIEGLDYTEVDLVGDLSDTVRIEDKILFTLFSMNIIVTPFLAGFIPQYFYMWHTMKACFLLSLRLWCYRREKLHYFLFDFCYFTNLLLLIYLWLIPPGHIAGYLFMVLFCFANGPLLWATALWRNSLVFHSVDKMTSLFIHISPAVTVTTLRWYSTSYTTYPTQLSGDSWAIGFSAFVVYPILCYAIWQAIYFLWVDLIRKKHVERNELVTSYNWMVERRKQGLWYRLVNSCGPQWNKPMYIVLQFCYTILVMLPCYVMYYSLETNVLAVLIFLSVACWNGAQYYIDIFSERYHLQFEKLQ
ncbi:uncharacterized protein [Dysidea avara]|uniref:uncharacterized protein n=1 Tax=Dysidea avara TaxID=196820 RepID=UPI0033309199